MRELTDQALQRLYWACQSRKGFPGEVLDESTRHVSTIAILKGLGLVEPDFEGPALPKVLRQQSQASKDAERLHGSLKWKEPEEPANASSGISRIQTPSWPETSRIDQDQGGSDPPSPLLYSFCGSQMPFDTSSIITSQPASSGPPTPSEMDMQEQFAYVSARSLLPQPSCSTIKAQGPKNETPSGEILFETYLDLDNHLDTSFCT